MSVLGRISRSINHWVEYLLFGFGLSMAIIVAAQVFCRYVLNRSLFWSEELARYLLVWLTFLGASVAYYRKAHPGIDVVYSKMPGSLKKIAALFVHLASMALFGIMIFYGYTFSYFVRLQITPALSIPKWMIFSIIPISGLILMVHGLVFLINELRGNSHDG